MAQIQDSQGVASVTPRVDAPDDQQRIQANPSAFGAAPAAAAEKIGAAAHEVSHVFGQVQTDDAINSAMSTVNQHLDSFRSLEGQDALRARESTQNAIDEAFKQSRSGLKLPEQQLQFDQATRAYQVRYVQGIIASHSDQAAKTYQSQTNRAAFELSLANVANVADNDEQVDGFAHDAIQSQIRETIARGNGNDPDATQAAALTALRAVRKTQIETVAVKNPVRARDLVEKYKDVLGLDYAELAGRVHARANTAEALGITDQAFGQQAQVMANPPAGAETNALREALLQQESGNKGPNPGQITPATWERFKTEGLVHEGESYQDPVATRAVAARAIDKYSEQYQDPQRVAVAWFSGPGNVAPAGAPQAWLHDRTDGNKTVSAYVQDISNRMGTQGPMLAAKAGIYDRILAQTEGRPEVRKIALAETDQRYKAAATASLESEAALKAQRESGLRQIGDAIAAGQSVDIRANKFLSEEQAEHLEGYRDKVLQERINGRPGDYGPGYAGVVQRIFSSGQDRIQNLEQLLPLTAGPNAALNPTGYAEASKQLAEVNKPGAEADRILQSNFYASARKQVTLELDGYEEKSATPDRLRKWDAALPVLNQALAAGRAKGLSNTQLMDPENKDSVWAALKPFLPTPAEKAKALTEHDDLQVVQDWQALATPEAAQAAYRSHQITRDQARILFDRHKWGAPAPAAPPPVPVGP